MPFTYSGDPASTNRDAVRFLVGDTNANDPELLDAEVDFVIHRDYPLATGTTGTINPYLAAAAAASAIAAKYTRQVTKQVGNLRIEMATRRDSFRKLAKELRLEAMASSVLTPYAGGTSVADKQTQEQNDDRTVPAFGRKTQSYPQTLNPPPQTTPQGW